MTTRRAFLSTMGFCFLTAPLAAQAQPSEKLLPRIGFLSNEDPKSGTELLDAFRQGLRELGWTEGQTITIEYRWAYGQSERLREAMAGLVSAKSDIIVVSGSSAIEAARRATSRIPIVIAALLVDPVSAGFVASLSRPGGNITGLASQYEEIVTKQVQLLTEAVPGPLRLVLLQYAGMPRRTVAAATDTLGLRTHVLSVKAVADIEAAFRASRDERAQAVHVLPSPFFSARRRLLVSLAARYRLPAMYEFREYVQDGGLMSYGASLPEMFRRAASYVDRILRGATPGDLPIERPTKFELVINLKTAKALGLTIPPSVVERADEVIQ